MSQPSWAPVLGRVPSGLYILSARHGDQETGMLASWVMQAGFEPPMVTVALGRDRFITKWVESDAPFALSLLADDQKPLISHFARGFEPGVPAFEGLEIVRTPLGLPAIGNSLGYVECRARSSVVSGDHRIFLAEVVGGDSFRDGQPYVHIRKSGQRY
jgi:flavin reductase (DIM6/NTAB) family NADH-FMN oxidoreductase RutF